MKNALKKAISILLVAVMVFGAAPLAGFVGLELPELNLFSRKAEAVKYTSGYYTYTVDENGNATIENVDTSISGDVVIPSELGGYPIVSIGDWAFANCKSLTSITICNKTTSIGEEAFACSDKLTNITIPDSVTTIGCRAFYDTGYFRDESNWENGVLYIGKHLITAKTDILTNIYEIKNGTLTIAESAFYNCQNLTNIKIPNTVTSIDGYAFSSCFGLTNITIGDSVTSIGNAVFRDCISITSITIPDSVISIGYDAFLRCKSLTNVTIGEGVTKIGNDAFLWCSSLTNIVVDVDNAVYSSDKFGVLFNKNKTELIQYPMGNTRTSYEIPYSVINIGEKAFARCASLTNVIIGDSVTSIGESAFDYCTSLISVTIGNSVISIGKYAFSDCTSLKSIKIGNRTEYIAYGAFSQCSSLANIIIPDSVKSIGQYAFRGCDCLDFVHMSSNINFIGRGIFLDDTDTYICSNTENLYAKQYSLSNGIEFRLCDGSHSIDSGVDDENNNQENTNTLKLIHSSPANKATAVSYDDDLIIRFNQNITERFGPESLGYGELAIRNYDTDETVFSTYDVFKGYSMSSMPEVQDNCLIIRGAFKRIEPGEKYYVYLSSGVIKAETNSALSFDGFTDKDDYTFSYLSPSDKEGSSIDVYSSQPMVNIAPDEEIEIKVVLSYDGKPCKQDGITFSIADGSVAEIAEIVKQSENTRVIIRGKKQGATPLNITATYDNVSCSVPITVTTEKTVYYSTDLEQFYDGNPLFIDGMFIDNFDIVENDDGSAKYNFDVYNADCCIGAVDVYTSSGKRTESVMIDKFDGDYPSNIFEHTETAMKMLWHIGDYLDVNQYKGSTQTEKTSVSVYVPANGYFTITKSILDSDSCAIYNISNLGFEVVSSIAKKLKSKESEITEEMAEKVLSEEQKTYIEFIDKIRQKFLKEEFKLTTEIASGFTDELLENTGKLFVAAGKPIIDCIIDVAKSYFEKDIYDVLFGITWGSCVDDIINNCYYAPIKVAKLCSQIALMNEYADYSSVYVYQKQNDGERVSNGVKAKSEMLKDNVIFHSVTITSGDEVDYVKSIHNPDVHCDVLDISVVQNGEISDLIYPVTVYIPIPEGWDQEKISVYHVGDDNKHEKLSITVENGYIKFTTDDFSPFIIASGEIDFMDNFTINNLNNSASVNYGDSLLLSTNDLTLPEGAYIKWELVSGKGVELNQSADGKNCKVTSVSSGTATVKAVVVDRNGVPIKNGLGNEIASEQTITSKAGFFQKIISFFKNLFGMNRTVVQTVFKGIY